MLRKRKVNYHLIYCFIIGLLLGYYVFPKQQSNNTTLKIKMIVIKDSVKVQKTSMLPLNEKNLKKVLKENNIHHSNIVLAQAKLETGNFTSKVCKSKGNLFGLRKGNKYRQYSHWTESVLAYKRLIQSRYKGGNYLAFLNTIGYAEDPNYLSKLKSML